MTLAQYWSIIVKHWKLIVICLVVGGLGAYVGSKLITPIYQSTALVQIGISSGNSQYDYYTALLASNQLTQTEATLATSDPVLREVASHYPDLTVDELSQEVTAAPKVNTQLFEIDVLDSSPSRAAALANDIAATLIEQQNQLTNQNTAQAGSFLVIAQAGQPALKPARPNILLNTAAGLIAGLLLGMVLAVIFEQLDTRVRTPEMLSQILGLPILATVWKASSVEEIINPKAPDANSESYRILRTNIGFSAIDKPVRSLAVISALPHEGKSSIAANLAIFMARAGKRTLLVDGDLRRPSVHEIFNLPPDKKGLSNALLAFSLSTTIDASAYRKSTIPDTPGQQSEMPKMAGVGLDPFLHTVDVPNLFVVPSGPLPPNPSELLDSRAMQDLYTSLVNSGAEIVIFDTPPLLGVSDTSVLASKTDGILIVADITRARKENLRLAKTLLAQTGARVLGCVVNKQRRSRKDTLYSYYYYSSGDLKGRKSRNQAVPRSAAIFPVTPDNLEQSKKHPQQDLSDNTVRLVPASDNAVRLVPLQPSKEVYTSSRSDVANINTVKTPSTHPVQPETRLQPNQLDGRQGG